MDIDVDTARAQQTVQMMVNGFIALLPRLLMGLVILFVFYLLARGVKSLILRNSRGSGAGKAAARLAQLGLLIGGFLMAAAISFPSVTPADALGMLGVGGVAIGFAFRDILQNYFAGILLLWREPFKVGDQIRTTNGFEGTIESIETRATFMNTYDGRRVVIPNSNLFVDSVIVNTADEKRRSEADIGIGYGDDLERARELLLETVRGVEGVLAEPEPDVLVVDLADFDIKVRVRWWSHPQRIEVLRTQDRVLRALKRALNQHGIDMPFPTQQILFHNQTEETDGDRARQREGWPKGRQNPRPAWELETREEQTSHS